MFHVKHPVIRKHGTGVSNSPGLFYRKVVMLDNEFLLNDRLQKIQQIITRYGENNFYISYSGGKDSTVLHELVDMAIPGNSIPRVYANTGIELNMIRDFVINKSLNDDRFIIIKPITPIRKMLDVDGYPFKSKKHSECVSTYQRSGKTPGILQYLGERTDKKPWGPANSCPAILKYQFSDDFNLKISDKCCLRLKEEPLKKYELESGRHISIIGLMRDEGGRRSGANCLAFRNGHIKAFQPLAPMTKEWENWFIDNYNIELCDIYKPPYNFKRTGCKGCPFNPQLQQALDILETYFPDERKQCELIWEPVYKEYRRIGYRLKGEYNT